MSVIEETKAADLSAPTGGVDAFMSYEQGVNWAKAPDTGIYLWGRDASMEELAAGGSAFHHGSGTLGVMKGAKLRGWRTGKQIVPGDVATSEQLMEAVGVTWSFVQRPVGAVMDDDGEDIGIAPRHIANVRVDNGEVLGIVGSGWRGPQPRDCFSMADVMLDDADGKWLAGGEIDGGRRIYGLAQLDRRVIVGGMEDEACLPLLFFGNGYDGGAALRMIVAPFRLGCMNGMCIPLPGCTRVYGIRHTKNFDVRMKDARKALELTIGYIDAFEETANAMVETKVDPADLKRFIEALVPLPPAEDSTDRKVENVEAVRKAIRDLHDHSDNLGNIRGTAWGALQAVGEYVDWGTEPGVKDEARREELKLERAFAPNAMKDEAFALLAKL